MHQIQKADVFHSLHAMGAPVILYNVWDAGSAKAVQDAGARAIATSSWAIAAAHGYADGQAIPLDLVEQIVARIMTAVDVPLTVDFEGGYSEDPATAAANVTRLLNLGVVGVNFEDRRISGVGLYGIEQQCARIAAIRKAAEEHGIRLFINARTDLFLNSPGEAQGMTAQAVKRASAYADAGASGFFVPGLWDEALISEIVERSPIPINVMVMDDLLSVTRLSELGVRRISYGPSPFISTMASLRTSAEMLFAPSDAHLPLNGASH